MALTPEQLLAARAIDCIVGVNPKNIERARRGTSGSSSVTVYWPTFLALVDAVEAAYPGVIADTRKLMKEG